MHRFQFEVLESKCLLVGNPALINHIDAIPGDRFYPEDFLDVGDVFTTLGGELREDIRKRDETHGGTVLVRDLAKGLTTSFPTSDDLAVPLSGNAQASPSIPLLREYRLAVAATGEYTQAVGGTVAAAMFEIELAVDRVNSVFERDLGIRLTLVENNEDVVYTNPFTDPYTNDNSGMLIAENQLNLDAVIGNVNYDVGHVFSTSAAGAISGVVGLPGLKARGASGHPFPFFDDFYIDIFAHELGHQFNADHTFNGDSGFCPLHRNGATAVEPGSGSTIMGYAGLCGDDNLQPFAHAYFHSVSIDQITRFVDTVIPNVGEHTMTQNTAPAISANSGFTIPARTPFTLDATATDTDGDVITYTWEQIDLGPPLDVNAPDNGSSPLFRSSPPSRDSARTFPRLDHILSGTNSLGETLPTTNRDLNYRVTARDNHAGGGAIDYADVVLHVIDTGAPFQITEPSDDILWSNNTSQSVTWSVSGTDVAPINAATVDIMLSTDGGRSFPFVLAADTPNDGDEQIVVPDGILTDRARVKIQPVGNVFFDITDVDFSIGGRRTCDRMEDFDSVVSAVLPAGWTSSGTAAEWRTVDIGSHSMPNHAFVPDQPAIGDNRLTSPSIPIVQAGPQLRFQNHLQSELFYDGGVLEISIDGVAFRDILEAGGTFIRGGYNVIIPPFFGNPLGNRLAWSGDSQGYFETIVNLPESAIGHDVRLRWRQATDEAFRLVGWNIDTIDLCSITAQGDLNEDGRIDATDIDLLFGEVGSTPTERTDLNDDDVVDEQDAAFLIETIMGTAFGDVNLDWKVDNKDFGGVLGGFGVTGLGWKGGDVNGDLITDNKDFGRVLGNFGFGQ